MKNNLVFYKFLAMLGISLYIYKAMRANGGTLKGIKFDSDRFVDHAMIHIPVHDDLKPYVSKYAKIAVKNAVSKRGL